jgi:hypothetical protein
MRIRSQHIFPPGEGCHQHEQRGPGQMEIGKQGAHHAKLKSRIDEYIGLAGAGADLRRIA